MLRGHEIHSSLLPLLLLLRKTHRLGDGEYLHGPRLEGRVGQVAVVAVGRQSNNPVLVVRSIADAGHLREVLQVEDENCSDANCHCVLPKQTF